MIFEIDEIPNDGLKFKLRIERSSFEIKQPDCLLIKDVDVFGRLLKIENEIFLNAKVQTGLELNCSRCLIPVFYPVDCKVSAKFIPRHPLAKLERERELSEADLETEGYVENKIEIKHVLHDHIFLTMPMVCLCNENCLGLCSNCGTDLNIGSCECSFHNYVDPRLEILSSLKDKIG